MNDLVVRLSEEQDVEAWTGRELTFEHFKDAVNRGYIHVNFVKTETILGVRKDSEPSLKWDLSKADFEKAKGQITIGGKLVLNYVRVLLHATIDLETLKGKGRLEFLEAVTPAQLSKERAAKEAARAN